jgi:hypothetical protein
MINMEAAKYTFKVVGIAVGFVSSVILYFWFLSTQFGIYGLIFGCLFVIICLASTVVYGEKKSEIEFKKRYNR